MTVGLLSFATASTPAGYDNTAHWPSVDNRPSISGSTLTWVGPVAGGASTTNDVRQSLVLTNSSVTGSTSDGQVISGLNLTAGFVITHANVTLKRCRITAGGYATVGLGSGGTIIEDCLVDATGSADQLMGISYGGGSNFESSNATIRRCNIVNAENDLGNGWASCLIIDNWLHAALGTGVRHADLMEVYSSTGTTIQHNYFDGHDYNTELNSGLNVSEDNGSITGLQIINNAFVNLPSWTICFGDPTNEGVSCSGQNNGFYPGVNNRGAGNGWTGTISPNTGNFTMANATATSGSLVNGTGVM